MIFGLAVESACLYARHLGWLSATPEQKGRKGNDNPKNRWELYKDSAYTQAEPEDSARWLIEISQECGMYQNNGMGIDVVQWSEIESYLRATGQSGWYWLASVLRGISQSFVDEFRQAKDPLRPCPLDDEVDEDAKRKAVSNQVKSFFKSKS